MFLAWMEERGQESWCAQAMKLILYDEEKKFYQIKGQIPMDPPGVPGSEEEMQQFYHDWLPKVAARQRSAKTNPPRKNVSRNTS